MGRHRVRWQGGIRNIPRPIRVRLTKVGAARLCVSESSASKVGAARQCGGPWRRGGSLEVRGGAEEERKSDPSLVNPRWEHIDSEEAPGGGKEAVRGRGGFKTRTNKSRTHWGRGGTQGQVGWHGGNKNFVRAVRVGIGRGGSKPTKRRPPVAGRKHWEGGNLAEGRKQ